jgi:ferritin-like metal-binding protein YciE
MKTLHTLFLAELADIYDAEKRLTKALPKLAKAASDESLRAAFEAHLEETESHVQKVEQVFEEFETKPRREKCEAIEGLLKEGDQIASENKNAPTIDAALISAAQKVEHYEIASYGCLREWARQLDMSEAVSLLDEILEQEKAADEKLTEIARSGCNAAAEVAA